MLQMELRRTKFERKAHMRGLRFIMTTFLMNGLAGCGCDQPQTPSEAASRLAALERVTVTIGDQQFEAWVADDGTERAKGLMSVTADQMAPVSDEVERAMIFVFQQDQPSYAGFWMKNTIIPLDIAYIRLDGSVVSTHTMAPLDTTLVRPTGPYRFALEVNANLLSRLGVKPGDPVEIPNSVLNNAS